MATTPKLDVRITTMVDSFELSLRAVHKSDTTIERYISATMKLARWLARQPKPVTDWAAVTKTHLEQYQVWFQSHARGCWCGKPRSHAENECPKGRPYEVGYANNQYRSYQQFWKWWSTEEDLPNPMATLSPPVVDEEAKVVPVFEGDELARLIRQCEKGRDFESRRDAALLRLFACAGGRLAEISRITLDDLDLKKFEVLVTGKGNRQRILRFDAKCAQALDRYLRARLTLHKHGARYPQLWLGIMNRPPLTPNGVRQIVERRGRQVGIHVWPHRFRHHFSHAWLDGGGAEGDLMELNGWKSPQMLRRYGRSARSARARRAYDRVNVMGDI